MRGANKSQFGKEHLMKITVFGATGGTGKQLVEQAPGAEYEVVAYVRNPSKLNITHEHLTVVRVNCLTKRRLKTQ
jgi:putative NADH-flavin reductase